MTEADLKRIIEFSIPYIGGVLSVNRYKYKGGIYTKREVKQWMVPGLTPTANYEKRRLKSPSLYISMVYSKISVCPT